MLSNVVKVALVAAILYAAYDIRLYAVIKYGKVIHEFDPWFNYRAAEYMVTHGVKAFFSWFDDQSWYPIGRHVGHSIYPGLQLTSAAIYHTLNAVGYNVTINDVCVYIPAYFGSLTTMFTILLSTEITGSSNAGIVSGAIMSILPAHLMRSVAGGFDNESIALCAIVATFYFWLRSIRSESYWTFWAFITALSYAYTVAAWGAYVFVLNMIGLHAALLVLCGYFSNKLHISYSIFYVLGTIGALQVYPVGWQPLQSAEQLMPMLVFFGLQFWAYIERSRERLSADAFLQYRMRTIAMIALFGVFVLYLAGRSGFIGPLSSRVSSLFIPHTRTGNPLVDSVAEHQPTRAETFFSFFHFVFYLAPFGFGSLFTRFNEARIFGIALTLVSFYFSRKMTRLVLLLSPAASICGGAWLAIVWEWSFSVLISIYHNEHQNSNPKAAAATAASRSRSQVHSNMNPLAFFENIPELPFPIKLLIVMGVVIVSVLAGSVFWSHCHLLAEHLSEPQVVLSARGPKGPVIVDDFREAYWWLRDNTPQDSRVMAWWDYGYQINGIANRTSIADGNTWNFEHIALLGRTLVSTEDEAHKVARHLADYVLVWTCRHIGMMNDDLAKMPQLANIAGSIYPEIERMGYFVDRSGNPTPKARESLLYKMTWVGLDDGKIKLSKFKEVYTTKHRMVRIFKVLDRAKRAPFGDYPPEVKPLYGYGFGSDRVLGRSSIFGSISSYDPQVPDIDSRPFCAPALSFSNFTSDIRNVSALSSSTPVIRQDSLHLRGVRQLLPSDIYRFTGQPTPLRIEWLGQDDCNIIYDSLHSASSAWCRLCTCTESATLDGRIRRAYVNTSTVYIRYATEDDTVGLKRKKSPKEQSGFTTDYVVSKRPRFSSSPALPSRFGPPGDSLSDSAAPLGLSPLSINQPINNTSAPVPLFPLAPSTDEFGPPFEVSTTATVTSSSSSISYYPLDPLTRKRSSSSSSTTSLASYSSDASLSPSLSLSLISTDHSAVSYSRSRHLNLSSSSPYFVTQVSSQKRKSKHSFLSEHKHAAITERMRLSDEAVHDNSMKNCEMSIDGDSSSPHSTPQFFDSPHFSTHSQFNFDHNSSTDYRPDTPLTSPLPRRPAPNPFTRPASVFHQLGKDIFPEQHIRRSEQLSQSHRSSSPSMSIDTKLSTASSWSILLGPRESDQSDEEGDWEEHIPAPPTTPSSGVIPVAPNFAVLPQIIPEDSSMQFDY